MSIQIARSATSGIKKLELRARINRRCACGMTNPEPTHSAGGAASVWDRCPSCGRAAVFHYPDGDGVLGFHDRNPIRRFWRALRRRLGHREEVTA